MTDNKCTQKELIEEKFKGVYLHQEVNFTSISETLARIETQTTKTNGRVTELEAVANRQKGAMIAITAIYTFTVAIITIYLSYKGI